MKPFKVRASACGSIMTGKHMLEASDAQLANIVKMEAREKPMTVKQKDTYDKDVYARDNPRPNPELPAGAKTFCQNWLRENLIYNRRKEFSSKYTDKGNLCESKSIDFLNQQLLEDWVKCEESKENDFSTGTCDIEAPGLIVDIKNSWDSVTFPLFDFGIKNKDYFYQLQIYMELYDKPRAMLAYTLMNAPFHLIEREAKSKAYHANVAVDDIYHDVHKHMTYGDVDPKYRFKLFHVDRDPSVIEKVKARVKLCQEYINKLVKELEK